MYIYPPGTAQVRMNAHPVDRARQPFDLGLLQTANAVLGGSSATWKLLTFAPARRRAQTQHPAVYQLVRDENFSR